MLAYLPLTLIFAFIAFFGFLNTHQRHARNFQGVSQAYYLALILSVSIGSIVGLGLLIYYGIKTAWYWPVLLFIVGSLIGGFPFGWLDAVVGLLGMSLLSFIGWPIAAYIMYRIVSQLGP